MHVILNDYNARYIGNNGKNSAFSPLEYCHLLIL
jgi:hypothetical protein